jgi:hypothetical protein
MCAAGGRWQLLGSQVGAEVEVRAPAVMEERLTREVGRWETRSGKFLVLVLIRRRSQYSSIVQYNCMNTTNWIAGTHEGI